MELLAFLLSFVLFATPIVVGVFLVETARRKLGRRLCGQCGYNLRGMQNDAVRCPECGTAFRDLPPREPHQRSWLKARALLGVCLIVLPILNFCLGHGLAQAIQEVWRMIV